METQMVSSEQPPGGSDGTTMKDKDRTHEEAVIGKGGTPLAELEVSIDSDSPETLSTEEDSVCALVQEEDGPEQENGMCFDSECVVKQEAERCLSESADGLVDGSDCDPDESGIEDSRRRRTRTRPLNDPRSSRTCKQRRSSSEQRDTSEPQRNEDEVSEKTVKEERMEIKEEDGYEMDEYELLSKEGGFDTKERPVGSVVGSIIVFERKAIFAEQDYVSEPQWSKQEDCGRMEEEDRMEIKEEDHSEEDEDEPKVNEDGCEKKGELERTNIILTLVTDQKPSADQEDVSVAQRNVKKDWRRMDEGKRMAIKEEDHSEEDEDDPKPKGTSCESREGLVDSDVGSPSVGQQRGGAEQLCPDCGLIYTTRTHKCGTEKLFPCPRCCRRFTSELSLTVHRLNCKGPVVYKCRFCLACFSTSKDKRYHQDYTCRSAADLHAFLCSECPLKFFDIYARNNHLREHPSKRFICKTCHKEFGKKHILTRHEFSHSDDKPFKCKVCSRAFAQSSHLKSHMRVHTGERPYQCSFCQMSFNHNISLKNHISRYHRNHDDVIQHSEPKPIDKRDRGTKPQPPPQDQTVTT